MVESPFLQSQPPFPKNFSRPLPNHPPGVDIYRFKPIISSYQLPPTGASYPVSILFVGRLDDRKGIKYLLKAYKELKQLVPKISLTICGTGPKEQQARDYVKKEHLTEVHFTGMVNDAKLPRYFAQCDIFCSPATRDESFGLV